MASAADFVKYSIQIGLVLMSLGEIPQVTRWLANELIHSQPKMLSIGKFNRMLVSGGRHGGRR